jgi:hypothetical protein
MATIHAMLDNLIEKRVPFCCEPQRNLVPNLTITATHVGKPNVTAFAGALFAGIDKIAEDINEERLLISKNSIHYSIQWSHENGMTKYTVYCGVLPKETSCD